MIRDIITGSYKYYYFILISALVFFSLLAIFAYRKKNHFSRQEIRNYGERNIKRKEWIFSTLFAISIEIIIVALMLGGTFQYVQILIQEDFRVQQELLDKEKAALEEQRREDDRKDEEEKEARDKAEEEEKWKDTLIFRMSSSNNASALKAFEEIKDNGWHNDGSLRNQDFSEADLQQLNFSYINSCEVDAADSEFDFAKLQDSCLNDSNFARVFFYQTVFTSSYLRRVNFDSAYMQAANLSSTKCVDAIFTDTYLEFAGFNSANLSGADFSGANLSQANLAWADLTDAIFNEETILPDRTHWSEDVDMDRFTDPDHNDFFVAIGLDFAAPGAVYSVREYEGTYDERVDFLLYQISFTSPWDPEVNLTCYPTYK